MEPRNSFVRVVPFVVAFGLTGCTQQLGGGRDEAAETVGGVQVALTGTDSRMQVYRLRQATFDIQGTRYTDFQSVFEMVSSEEDLDAASLTVDLVRGAYSVTLRPDWHLERITDSGAVPVQAVLLSPVSQSVFIEQHATSRVAFQFGVDGDMVIFFGGELDIEIEIETAPDAGAGAEEG
jgi:hypothetical protein